MNFKSDAQRRATFWSIRNRFAAKSTARKDCVSGADAIASDIPDDLMLPVFKGRVDYVSIEDILRSQPVIMTGYTGSDLVAYPSLGEHEPHVHYDVDGDDIEATGKDTYILAGENYRDSSSRIVDPKDKRWIKYFTELERESGKPVFAESPDYRLTRDEKIAAIDKMNMDGVLTPDQSEMLAKVRKDYVEGKMSKRPQAIGSKWKGENYEHGPRIRQPKDFIFMKTVDYDEKYRKFEDGYRLPKDMPKGSKVVIGRLKDGGKWAVQSSLTPL